jgi:hypothetical protein
MRISIRFSFAAIAFLAMSSFALPDELDPPAAPEPINESLVQYVTVQMNGENEVVLIPGKDCKITGEFELAEGGEPLEWLMVKLFIHSDTARNGESIISEALAEMTLVEGSRYVFSADLIVPGYNNGGEVELRLVTEPPRKQGHDPIYRATVPLLGIQD